MFSVVVSENRYLKTYNVVLLDDGLTTVVRSGQVAQTNMASVSAIPLNYSLQNGLVKQDCGKFERIDSGAVILLAELVDKKTKKTLGYRVLSCKNLMIMNLERDKFLQYALDESRTTPFCQNAIIRNNTVNCFAGHPFPVIQMELGKKMRPKPEEGRFASNRQAQFFDLKEEEQAHSAEKPVKKVMDDQQKSEVHKAQAKGVDPKLISNPNLSSKQMRVLWVAKSNGAYAEAFNNPDMNEDVMKFYADRVFSKSDADALKPMLDRPDLSYEQVNSLYNAVLNGVPIENLVGRSSSMVEAATIEQTREYWAEGDVFAADPDLVEKARGYSKYAMNKS